MTAITLTVLTLLAGGRATTGCIDRCNETMNKCSERCGTNDKCMSTCSRRSQPCVDGCIGSEQKEHAKEQERAARMPCDVNLEKRTSRPCTDEEQSAMKEKVKEQMKKGVPGLCKDPKGQMIACPGEDEKIKAAMKKLGLNLDCKDANGNPTQCPTK